MTPSPLLALAITALILLILAIFVFGQRGKYPDPDVADLLRTVAVGVFAAGVATLIDRRVTFSEVKSDIDFGVRMAAGVAKELTELGIRSVYEPFDYSRIFQEARRGDDVWWLDTYCPRQNEFIDQMLDTISRGVHIRMLIIDPTSESARHRNAELETTVDTGGGWDTGLAAFTAKMEAIAHRSKGVLEIRKYSDLPGVPMYLLVRKGRARKGYFSIYLSKPTAAAPHVELTSGRLLTDMANYFEAKWNRQHPSSSMTKI